MRIVLFCLSLQIATFFSNNLDFFTAAAYSPKGSTVALSPLQAESMLANKKKASAYIHAIRKVRWLNYKMLCNFAFLCKNDCSMLNHLLLLSVCLPLAPTTVGSVQPSPVQSSYSHKLHREQRRPHSAGMLLARNTLFKTHFGKLESICVKGMFHFSKMGHWGPAAVALLSSSCEQLCVNHY